MTTVLRVDGAAADPEVLAAAELALRRGELLIYPTETLYALGGTATGAVARLVRAAKRREAAKPLPLVAADVDQARALCAEWPEAALRLSSLFWPGPLTLVLVAGAWLAKEIGAGTGRVAVRVPGLRLPRELCRRVGPLISTSANGSGEPPHARCDRAVAAVGAHVALALDAGELGGRPSTIVDLTRTPRVLRAGALDAALIAEALRGMGASLQTEAE